MNSNSALKLVLKLLLILSLYTGCRNEALQATPLINQLQTDPAYSPSSAQPKSSNMPDQSPSPTPTEQYCLKPESFHGNLEYSLENKILTEEDFLSNFSKNELHEETQCLSLSYSSFHPGWLRHLPLNLQSLKLSSVNTNLFREYGFSKQSTMITEILETLSNTLPRLKFLDLSNNNLVTDELATIAKLSSLRSLDISGNQLGDLGAAFISHHLKFLNNLNISSNKLGTAGAETIAKLSSLTSLDISKNYIRHSGAVNIAKITSLRSLNISGNQLGNPGAAAISGLPSLQSLDISENAIGSTGAAQIATMTSLLSLNISQNLLGARGAKEISKMTSLQSLDISHNILRDSGIVAIVNLSSLQSLNISDNAIRSFGAANIAKLIFLRFLDISGNELEEQCKHELHEKLPLCQIQF